MVKSSDYHTAAKAIRFLQEGFKTQPSLEEVARHVGVSPFHFQRLFTRWAGVSPKRFLQFLTVEHAKDRLRASEPVLRVALESGLSGPARLHDLFVTTEAVTPGEFKAMGDQVRIGWGIHDSPFGAVLLGVTSRGLCHLVFLGEDDPGGTRAFNEMRAGWPRALFVRAEEDTGSVVRRVFPTPGGRPGSGPLPLLLKGTNFQIRVWTALLRIPPGKVTTYGRLAEGVHRPGSARAVGAAVGRNPIAFLIPCHRVIRGDGGLGGYRWGTDRKGAMLGWEAARAAI